MPSRLQHTLNGPVSLEGIGVHTGLSVVMTLAPASPGMGIRFLRSDVVDRDPVIPARADRVTETRLGTVISNEAGVSVSTVEHILAVFHGLGVDNALVTVNGPEAPIMDGSCEPFLRAVDGAGLVAQPATRRYLEILEPVEVVDGDKRAALIPADQFELAFEIAFDTAAIGRQRVDLVVDEATFRRELADCRTFGFLHEVEALRAAGLARGGTMDNVVVIDNGAVLNPLGLRRPDEFVRHKALDALGDLFLLGGPILGRYEARYSGHGLNNALARAVLGRPEAWRWSDAPRTLVPMAFARAV